MSIYLHDVWVNFFEDEENPNLVHYFHEWAKEDTVDLMDQFPLLYVNSNLFNYIAYGLNEVADDILKSIKNKAFQRKNHERNKVKYAFICTDGVDIMAFELDEYGYVHKKGRLIPRHEQLVYEMIEGKTYDFELDDHVEVSQYEIFVGLTRQEKEIGLEVTKFIDTFLPEKSGMLKYIIAEWDFSFYRTLVSDTFEDAKHKLLDRIKGSETGSLIELNKVIGKLKLIN